MNSYGLKTRTAIVFLFAWNSFGSRWPRKLFRSDTAGIYSDFVFFCWSHWERHVKMYIDYFFFPAARNRVRIILYFNRVFVANRAVNDVADTTFTTRS